MKWISVKERLPEPDIDVLYYSVEDGVLRGHTTLMFIDKRGMWSGIDHNLKRRGDEWKQHYTEEYRWFNSCGYSDQQFAYAPRDVTHWMPLPEKPDEVD